MCLAFKITLMESIKLEKAILVAGYFLQLKKKIGSFIEMIFTAGGDAI